MFLANIFFSIKKAWEFVIYPSKYYSKKYSKQYAKKYSIEPDFSISDSYG